MAKGFVEKSKIDGSSVVSLILLLNPNFMEEDQDV
jgi:hypothetical protein